MHGEHGVEWQHTFLYIPLSLSHFLIQSLLPAILYDLYLYLSCEQYITEV